MAIYTAIAAGGDFNTNATWGGAGHPIAGDTANLTSVMTGTVTIGSAAACAILNCTGCTGTLTMTTFSMTTTGAVTLVAGMIFNCGTATWNMGCATVTCTTGGKHFYNLNFNSNGTLTLADTCNVDGVLSWSATVAIATSDINCYGLSGNGVSAFFTGAGRTVNLKGGTWTGTSASAPMQVNVTITGSVTINTNALYGTGTLTSSGATLTFSATFNVYSSMTLTDSTSNWAAATISNYTGTGSSPTLTLSQATTITNLSIATPGVFTLATNNLTITGNIATTGTAAVAGQTITMTGASGTATWSMGGAGYIASNLTITGAVTISGNVYYKTGTINTSAATITWSSATFNVAGSCTLTDTNSGTPNWAGGTINGSATGTLTLGQTTTVLNLTVTTVSQSLTISSNNIIVAGNLTTITNATITGTQTITMTGASGTATWTGGSLNYGLGCNLVFLGGGNTITLGTFINVGYVTGKSVTYTSGNIVTTGSTLYIGNVSVTLNTAGMTWNNISSSNVTTTSPILSSALTCSGVFTISNNVTFSGSYIVTVGFITQGAFTLTLSANMTCTGNYTNTGTSIINGAFTLSIGGNLTLAFALSGTATINLTGGTWTASTSVCTLSNALNFGGNVAITGTVYYNNANLYWTSGTVTSVGNSITFVISCTLHGSSGMTFGTVIIPYNVTVTTDGNLTISTLNMYYLSVLTITTGSTLTVSTAMRLEYCTVQSSTSTPFTLTYNGLPANNSSAFTTFNYCNATILLYIWQATALTGTSNINNINVPSNVIAIDED